MNLCEILRSMARRDMDSVGNLGDSHAENSDF